MALDIRCVKCGKAPEELECYTIMLEEGETATEYVQVEEGTYNPTNGHFYCDDCYIKVGMPLGVAP